MSRIASANGAQSVTTDKTKCSRMKKILIVSVCVAMSVANPLRGQGTFQNLNFVIKGSVLTIKGSVLTIDTEIGERADGCHCPARYAVEYPRLCAGCAMKR